MNNFGEYITPKEAYELQEKPRPNTLDHYKRLAKKKDKICECCEQEKAWKLADTGMCFSCTTGEADASDDYELITEQANEPEQQPISGSGTNQA